MKTLDATSAGIDVKEVVCFVGDDFQNMGMAANEESRRGNVQLCFYARIVFAGVSANMGDPNVESFDGKPVVEGISLSDGCAVYISINGAEGLEGFKSFRNLGIADVAGMPYFIHLIEIVEYFWVKVTVGVR